MFDISRNLTFIYSPVNTIFILGLDRLSAVLTALTVLFITCAGQDFLSPFRGLRGNAQPSVLAAEGLCKGCG